MEKILKEIKTKGLKVCGQLDCRYAVNKEGDVYSLFSGRGIRKTLKKLKLLKDKDGYVRGLFTLDSGITYSTKAHRIVASCFMGLNLRDSNVIIHHKDGNKENNNINNLELLDRRKHSSIELAKSKLKEIRMFDKNQKNKLLSI